MQTPSNQTHPRFALFLTQEAQTLVSSLGRIPSWGEVAGWVSELTDNDTVPIATVIQASAIVCAYRDVLRIWEKADPERTDRLALGCKNETDLTTATKQIRLLSKAYVCSSTAVVLGFTRPMVGPGRVVA